MQTLLVSRPGFSLPPRRASVVRYGSYLLLGVEASLFLCFSGISSRVLVVGQEPRWARWGRGGSGLSAGWEAAFSRTGQEEGFSL